MTFEELLKYSYLLRTAHQDGRTPEFYKGWNYRFSFFNVRPFAGTRTIMFMAETRSITNPRKVSYKLIMQFKEVQFKKITNQEEADEYAKKKDWKYVQIQDLHFYYKLPSLKTDDVMVKCACFDFRFSFEYYNKQYGALVGQPRLYHSKNKLPPRNFKRTPGVCKHLYHFALFLCHPKNRWVDSKITRTIWGL